MSIGIGIIFGIVGFVLYLAGWFHGLNFAIGKTLSKIKKYDKECFNRCAQIFSKKESK